MLATLLLSLLAAPNASAADFIKLRVLRYEELLAPGTSVRCEYEATKGFGYLIKRIGVEEKATIEMISNGQLEGEKTLVVAEIKDYGTPLIAFLQHHKRYDQESGNYFEILLNKKRDSSGAYRGDVMFTDAYYVKEKNKEGQEVEREILKPVAKKKLLCAPVAAD